MARHASENVAVILPPGAINTGDPVEPRPSATVLLIRGTRPFEPGNPCSLVHQADYRATDTFGFDRLGLRC